MAENVPHGRHFSWKDEDQVLEEITQTPIQQPIILVGHSLGGDAAVSLANRLNSMEHGFRNVDLLVTLDSVGFDNDLIPPNVKRNLNFIGDEDVFLTMVLTSLGMKIELKFLMKLDLKCILELMTQKKFKKNIFGNKWNSFENRSFNELIRKF